MKDTWLVLACVAGFALAPQSACAWGTEGHEIVAVVAMRLLQANAPDVADKVTNMLATDTDNKLTAHDIAHEATWADAFRDHGTKPKSATSNWHFIDVEIEGADAGNFTKGCDATITPSGTAASDAPPKSCVVQKIKEFSDELGNPATTAAERLLALKYLLHFVGDVHQPLHASDHNDRGGNCVGVLFGRRTKPIKLHSYWDTIVVSAAVTGDLDDAAQDVLALATPENQAKWTSSDPTVWAQESFDRAKDTAYALPATPIRTGFLFPPQFGKPDSCGPVDVFQLSGDYEDKAEKVATEQLAKAAVRLAFILTQQLD